MKKLFKNYSLELGKNEKKILSQFCKQALKQTSGDPKYAADNKVYSSILTKIDEPSDKVKLTKEEYTRLSFMLKENSKFLKQQLEKAGFFKRWIYKSLYTQYRNILETHFSD